MRIIQQGIQEKPEVGTRGLEKKISMHKRKKLKKLRCIPKSGSKVSISGNKWHQNPRGWDYDEKSKQR